MNGAVRNGGPAAEGAAYKCRREMSRGATAEIDVVVLWVCESLGLGDGVVSRGIMLVFRISGHIALPRGRYCTVPKPRYRSVHCSWHRLFGAGRAVPFLCPVPRLQDNTTANTACAKKIHIPSFTFSYVQPHIVSGAASIPPLSACLVCPRCGSPKELAYS